MGWFEVGGVVRVNGVVEEVGNWVFFGEDIVDIVDSDVVVCVFFIGNGGGIDISRVCIGFRLFLLWK